MPSWLKTLGMGPRFREDDDYGLTPHPRLLHSSPHGQLFRPVFHFSLELRSEIP